MQGLSPCRGSGARSPGQGFGGGSHQYKGMWGKCGGKMKIVLLKLLKMWYYKDEYEMKGCDGCETA